MPSDRGVVYVGSRSPEDTDSYNRGARHYSRVGYGGTAGDHTG
jgi:hypothetical protein